MLPVWRQLYNKNFYRFCHKFSDCDLKRKLQLTLAIIKPHVCKDPSSVQVNFSLNFKNFVTYNLFQLGNTEHDYRKWFHNHTFGTDRIVSK